MTKRLPTTPPMTTPPMTTQIESQAAAVDVAAAALVATLDTIGTADAPRVSPTQLRVLTMLRDNPALNVNGLADGLRVGASSASRMCDRLEALGFLRRESDPRDRREVQLRLTATATDLLGTLAEDRRHALALVLAAMPERARRELVRALTAFADAAADEPIGYGERRTA
jgi:DNA-binding MarR family transcriptional regulator